MGRRRRTFFGNDSDGHPGSQFGAVSAMIAAADRHSSNRNVYNEANQGHDLFPGRVSSRRTRIDDLEELMMMEAIRQSIALEDERKRKDDKDSAKQAKKDEKQKQKEAKKAGKLGWISSPLSSGANESPLPSPVTAESSAMGAKGKAVDKSVESSPPHSTPSREITPASLVLTPPSTEELSTSAAMAPSDLLPKSSKQLSMSSSSASSFSDLHVDSSGPFEFPSNGSGVSLESTGLRSENPAWLIKC